METRTLFALSLSLALFTAGQAQTLDKAKLDQFFDRLAEKNKAMGSLVLAKDGEVLYARAIGYGQIDGAERKPLNAASRFRIGSITKMFTVVMILQLVDEGKLAVAYTTNAKVHPVGNIVSGVVDIYYNRPFQIPAFETLVVSPEILDKYVGVYSSAEVPVKFTVTREGSTLFIQPGNESAAPLEATAEDKFQILGGRVVFEFDAAKKQMILKRGGPPRVFTKEE